MSKDSYVCDPAPTRCPHEHIGLKKAMYERVAEECVEINSEPMEMKQIKIILKNRMIVSFNGRYRRDLEKPNWHYYEEDDGTMYHARKENMCLVIEKELE